MRAGRGIPRARPRNRWLDVFGSSVIELYDSNWGIALSADQLYVESWTGMVRGIALTPLSSGYRPKYEVDGAYWGGRKVVSCYQSSMSHLYSGILAQPIAIPSNRDFYVLAVCRARTAVAYNASYPVRSFAGAGFTLYWSGYWACTASLNLAFGWNGDLNYGYMGKYRFVSFDRASTNQWWPPPTAGSNGYLTPQVAGSGFMTSGSACGPVVVNWPNTRPNWGRGSWFTLHTAQDGLGQINRLFVGNLCEMGEFTEAQAPTPSSATSMDISLRMVAFLNREPTSAEFARLRAECAYGEGCALPTLANQT